MYLMTSSDTDTGTIQYQILKWIHKQGIFFLKKNTFVMLGSRHDSMGVYVKVSSIF